MSTVTPACGLKKAKKPAARLWLATLTDLTVMTVPLAEVGLDDIVAGAGSLERRIKAFRLPGEKYCLENAATVEATIAPGRDNTLWICVVTEDKFQA